MKTAKKTYHLVFLLPFLVFFFVVFDGNSKIIDTDGETTNNIIKCSLPSGLKSEGNYQLKIVSSSSCVQSKSIKINIGIPEVSGMFTLFKDNISQLSEKGNPTALIL